MFKTPPPVTPEHTLGADLRHIRAAHRVRRLERILAVLRDHRQDIPGDRPVPAGLTLSIDGFDDELARIRRCLTSNAKDAQ